MPPAARGRTSPGQILIGSAVARLVLLAMLGLALDGGRGYWERRQAQNAAEHAALAAAWEHCHPNVAYTSPTHAATQAATDNGFVHDGTTVWVSVTSPSTGVFQVVINSKLRTTFAAIMGFQTISA